MLCLVTDRRRLAPADAPFDASRRCLRRAGAARRRRRRRPHSGARARSRGGGAGGARRRSAGASRAARRPASSSTIGSMSRSPAAPTASTCAATRSPSRRRGAWRRPGSSIGRSVHGVGEAAQAAGADYLIAGTVFPSESKARRAGRCSVSTAFARLWRPSRVPVLAIGGVTDDRLDEVAAAGAGRRRRRSACSWSPRLRRTAAILPCDSARRHRRTRAGAV